MSPKKGDHPCPPGLSSGTVRIPRVIAPIPAKKITPKLVIPVIPVCKFKEIARIENAQTKTIILDICIDFVITAYAQVSPTKYCHPYKIIPIMSFSSLFMFLYILTTVCLSQNI